MGALVGAAYVDGKLDALEGFARQLTSTGVIKLLDVALSGGGLINGELIVELLRSLGVQGAIEEKRRGFAAVATDLETGREVWLRDGPIEAAVRASISIPGIFSPVRRDAQWFADGALVNPVPVSLCRALGADVIVAVHVNGDSVTKFAAKRAVETKRTTNADTLRRLADQAPALLRPSLIAIADNLSPRAPRSPGYFDVLLNAINIMEDQITRSRLAGEPPHLVITPPLTGIGLMEFQRASEVIEAGRLSMEQAMHALKRHLGAAT